MVRVFSHYIPIKVVVLLLLECLILAAAFHVGVMIRFAGIEIAAAVGPLWPKTLIFVVLIILPMAAVGFYHPDFAGRLRDSLRRLLIAFVVALGLMSQIFYLLPHLYLGRGVVGIALLTGFIGLAISRLILFKWTHWGIFRPRILVLGAGSRASELEKGAAASVYAGQGEIVGYLPLLTTQHEVTPARILSSNESILSVVQKHNVSEIVIAVRDRRGGGLPVQELLECKLSGVKITELSTFFERERGQVRLDSLNTSWMVFGDGFRQGALRDTSKRIFDVVISSLLLLVTMPIILLTILAVYMEDGHPVFYRQQRVGQGGRVFTIFKFRSMRHDAEKDGAPRWAKADDDRVTQVGRIIRKLRIDELPQIINVFKGEMSFVGPRPERPFFVDKLAAQIPYFTARHSVKPGITGWAQVRYAYGASLADAIEKLQYDLYYVKNHTLFLDIMILFETVRVVLTGKGAR